MSSIISGTTICPNCSAINKITETEFIVCWRCDNEYRQQVYINSNFSHEEKHSFARSQAIEFAKWLISECWICSSNDMWYKHSDGDHNSGITTYELYSKFIIHQSLNKKEIKL